MTTDEKIIGYLKQNGLYGAIAANVQKDAPTVGDVHVEAAGGDDGDEAAKKKKKPVGKVDAFEANISIQKVNPEQRLVFGWASVCSVNGQEIIDKQGDIIPVDELEKAAYDFVLYSREQGDMHAKRDVGKLVESIVFTPEKAALGIVAKNDKGEPMMGWWTGFRVNSDAVWDAVKSGRRPEFSIGGHATPTDIAA